MTRATCREQTSQSPLAIFMTRVVVSNVIVIVVIVVL